MTARRYIDDEPPPPKTREVPGVPPEFRHLPPECIRAALLAGRVLERALAPTDMFANAEGEGSSLGTATETVRRLCPGRLHGALMLWARGRARGRR